MDTMRKFARAIRAEDWQEPDVLIGLLERAMSLGPLLTASATGESIHPERIKEVQTAIYRTFGAVGDWGYSTPLGVALQAVYAWRPPQTSSCPDA